MSVAALIKAKEAKAGAPATAPAPAPKPAAASPAAPAKAAPAPALPAVPRASVDAKAAPAPATAAKPSPALAPPGGAAVTTRPRGASGAGSLTAPLPSSNTAVNTNALADGLTFVEKDAVASVQAVVDAVASKGVDQKTFRGVLGYVLKQIENGEVSAEVKAKLLSDAAVHALFVGLYDLLGSAVRSRVKDKDLASDLAKIGFPKAFADDLLSAVQVKRDALQASALAKRIALPTIADIQWRVDVTVSTTTLSRVFKPTIIVQLTLSDGQIKSFECGVEKFHELRYNVAKLLKAMQDVELHPTLLRVE